MSSATNNPKPFSLSHSKLQTFRRCLQKYYWKYVEGYYPPSSIGQVRGTAGHAALSSWHTYYNEELALDAAWGIWDQNNQVVGKEWDLLEASLLRYFEWSNNNHDEFKVLQAEREFEITYEVPEYILDRKGKKSRHNTITLVGFIDGLVEDQGAIWLLENKFYKRMDNSPLDLDPQVSTYLLAEDILGTKVQGVIYNIVRVADTKVAVAEPVVRRRLNRNSEGLAHIQEEILAQTSQMIEFHQGGTPYRNPTKDCHWDCPFYSACLIYTDEGVYPKDQLISLSQTRSQNGKESNDKETEQD